MYSISCTCGSLAVIRSVLAPPCDQVIPLICVFVRVCVCVHVPAGGGVLCSPLETQLKVAHFWGEKFGMLVCIPAEIVLSPTFIYHQLKL